MSLRCVICWLKPPRYPAPRTVSVTFAEQLVLPEGPVTQLPVESVQPAGPLLDLRLRMFPSPRGEVPPQPSQAGKVRADDVRRRQGAPLSWSLAR